MNELKPGIYPDIPASDYHGDLLKDYVSKSYLKRLDKCPAAARVPQEDSPALAFGRAYHLYCGEGEAAFYRECAVLPSGIDKRTKAGKEAWAQFEAANQGKTLVSADDFQKIQEMDLALKMHPFASKLLAEGQSEQTVIWQDEATGLMCKCRVDRIPNPKKRVLVDLKSCQCAGEYEFGRDVVKFGYALQAAFYLDGINAALGESVYDAFLFIAQEKEQPYRTETYILDPEFIAYGRSEYQRLIQIEADCRKTGEWPNYAGVGNLVTLFKPAYL